MAVIGGGAFGLRHIETLIDLGALGAICEASPERRHFLAGRFRDITVLDSLDACLQRDDIGGVVVATPPSTHHFVARRALEAGLDVLVEKPMTLCSADARSLVDEAEQRRRVLMVGHLLLYHPAYVALARAIHQGDLGEVRYFSGRRVKLGRVRAEENVLWSFAPHDLAVSLYLADETPSRIACVGASFVRPGVEDVAFVQMVYPSGRLTTLQVGWLEPQQVRRLVVVGSTGAALLDEGGNPALTITPQEVDPTTLAHACGQAVTPELPAIEPLRAELEHFLHCMATRQQPRSHGRQGLAVVHLLERATESLRCGGDWRDIDHDIVHPPFGADR